MRENLKKARQAKGLTQQALAEHLRISVRQYQRIEAGVSHGEFEMWDALEDMFNVHQRVLRENHPDKESSQ